HLAPASRSGLGLDAAPLCPVAGQLPEEADRLVVLRAARTALVRLVGLLLVQERVRRERAGAYPFEAPHRLVERPLRERPRLEAAADELAGGAALDEQDLDRLALLLEVDRDVGELALELEAAGGERLADRVAVAQPRDEGDV